MRCLWQFSRGWRFALSVLYRFTIATLLSFHDQRAQVTRHGIWLKRPLVPVKRLTTNRELGLITVRVLLSVSLFAEEGQFRATRAAKLGSTSKVLPTQSGCIVQTSHFYAFVETMQA